MNQEKRKKEIADSEDEAEDEEFELEEVYDWGNGELDSLEQLE